MGTINLKQEVQWKSHVKKDLKFGVFEFFLSFSFVYLDEVWPQCVLYALECCILTQLALLRRLNHGGLDIVQGL